VKEGQAIVLPLNHLLYSSSQKAIVLLRNCRAKFVVLNEFVSQESRSLFEIVEDSLSVLLFIIVESWVHIMRSVSEHTVQDAG
jgi:hypothetical protein